MIDQVERKGTVTYSVGWRVLTFTGWVSLSNDGKTVVARKPRGRNKWQLTGADSVLNFNEQENQ